MVRFVLCHPDCREITLRPDAQTRAVLDSSCPELVALALLILVDEQTLRR